MLKILRKLENFELIKQEVFDLVTQIGFQGPHKNQIICQSLIDNGEDWETGIGSVEELEVQKEQEYKYLQPSLKGTQIENIINEFSAFRSRIMVMQPKSCYSLHSDHTPRIHIPITSNNGCWMIWPLKNKCYRLMPGQLYWTDTTQHHTFINGGLEPRIHMVICVNHDKQ
jgi:hypothetical protein